MGQIKGKKLGAFIIPRTVETEEQVKEAALELPGVRDKLAGKEILRTVVVKKPNILINFVTKYYPACVHFFSLSVSWLMAEPPFKVQ